MKSHELLEKVNTLKSEIEIAVKQRVVKVPQGFIEKIQKDMYSVDLLRAIYHTASASVGLDIRETLSDHYDGGFDLLQDIGNWKETDKEFVQELLLNKIYSVKPLEKYDEVFFREDQKVTKEMRENVISAFKEVAECAIHYIFAASDSVKPQLHKKAFEQILQLQEPNSSDVTMRNLVSIDRLKQITKKEPNASESLEALKAVARKWYRESNRDFLERKNGYHQYTYVQYYLYLLTQDQLEKVREEFLEDVERRYMELKVEKWDKGTSYSAEMLLEKLETILSWEAEIS